MNLSGPCSSGVERELAAERVGAKRRCNTHSGAHARNRKTFEEFGGHAAAGGFTVRDTEVFFLKTVSSRRPLRITGEEPFESMTFSMHADAVITRRGGNTCIS